MKLRNYIAALVIALLTGGVAKAQETDNIINRYGPPYYTGGTVNSPSESFAMSQRYERQAQLRTEIESVYPNPTRTYAAIVLANVSREPVSIYVVNMNGVIVQSYMYSAGNRSYGFDMGNVPAGVYSIQVQERGKSMQSIELLKQE